MVTIETYKGVDIRYKPENGRLVFEFDGLEREVNYLFEAKQIIDEPRWEECSLEGYWIDGVMGNYIGTAKATRSDKKSGRPDWKLKGRYDAEYKSSGLGWRAYDEKVYPRTKELDAVYREWKVAFDEHVVAESKVRSAAAKLKTVSPQNTTN